MLFFASKYDPVRGWLWICNENSSSVKDSNYMSDCELLNTDPSRSTEGSGNLNLKDRGGKTVVLDPHSWFSFPDSNVLFIRVCPLHTHQQIPVSFGFISSSFPPDGITIQTSTHGPWYALSGHPSVSAPCNMVDEVIFTVKDHTSAVALSLTWPSAHPFSPAI